MANPIYPGIAGAPGYAGDYPSPDHGNSNNGGSPSDSGGTPPSDGGDNTPPTDTGSGGSGTGGSDTGGSGLISVDGSHGGIDAHVVDTDGDHSSLVDVHSDATNGILGDTLDGTHIDVVNADSLVDAHVPGVLDATVGDGTVADVIGGVADGSGIGGVGDLGGFTNAVQGIEIDALHDGNLLEAHAPGIADATVSGSDLSGILDGIGDTASDATQGLGGSGDGITVEALNGENTAEVHAGDIADATVGGGAELGSILGSLGDTVGDVAQTAGDPQGLNVEALNGDYVAEAHAPGTLDATVGGAELGNLIGGTDLGGLLGGGDLPLGNDGLLGDVLHIGTGGDIAGLDLGHTLDSVTS